MINNMMLKLSVGFHLFYFPYRFLFYNYCNYRMHYSQHSEVKSDAQKKSGKLHSAIEKAQAIQQREQLRKMVTDKFNKDFAKGNKNISKIIEDIVAQYFDK